MADVVAPEPAPAAPAASATVAAAAPAVVPTVQGADIPVIKIKLQTDGSDTVAAKAADRAIDPLPSEAPATGNRSAFMEHQGGGRPASDKMESDPIGDQPNTPAVAAVGPATLTDPAASFAATAGPAAPPAISTMAAPASDLMTGGAPPPSPVSQLGSALLTLGTASDGTQQMTLRLQPEELGTVEVRIERAPDGSARVSVTADNPDTLQLMSSAQTDLHKALDAAGIPSGRSVSFALGSDARPLSGLADLAFRPVTDDRSASPQSNGGSGSGGTPGQGTATGAGSGGSSLAGGSTGAGAGGNAGSQHGGRAWADHAASFQTASDPGADRINGSFQSEGI